jgi:hypothetical protein
MCACSFDMMHVCVLQMIYMLMAPGCSAIHVCAPIILVIVTMGEKKEDSKLFPAWAPLPTPTVSSCIVCSQNDCICGPKVKELLQAAHDASEGRKSDPAARSILYDDPLLKKRIPWLRVAMSSSSSEKQLVVTCWLCKHFLNQKPHGKAKLAKTGLTVASVQKGRLLEHTGCGRKQLDLWPTPGEKGVRSDHEKAMNNYFHRCYAWQMQNAPEDIPETQGQQDIRTCVDTQRKRVDLERANAVHLAYTCAFLKESAEEFGVHLRIGRQHGGRYYGDLYANSAWYAKAQTALANRIFEMKWNKLRKTPVLVICTDEAEGMLGTRAQYLDVTDGCHQIACCDFLCLMKLARFDAAGIADAT